MQKTKKQSLNLRVNPYEPISNTDINAKGEFKLCIKFHSGPHPILDELYKNVYNYDVNWEWTIKELYHEAVMNGQIVCTID